MSKLFVAFVALAAGAFVLASPATADAAPGKPDWCGSYKPTDDQKAKWVDGYIKSEGWTPRVRNYMALGACDKPDDMARQQQVDKWRAQYMAEMGGSTQDYSAMLAMYMSRDEVTKQQTAICGALSYDKGPTSVSSFDAAIADELDCSDVVKKSGAHIEVSDLLFWADRPGGSEIARSLIVAETMTRAQRNGDKLRGAELALADVATDTLDRAKLETELANPRYNTFAKVRLREVHNHAKALGAQWRTALDAEPEAKKIMIDAPLAALKAWDAAYQSHKVALDWAYDMNVKLNVDGNAQKGCSAKARDYLSAYLTEKKPTSTDQARTLETDTVGYVLLNVARQCEAIDGNALAALVITKDVFGQRSLRNLRGPRAAAFYATLDAFSDATIAKRSVPFRGLSNMEAAEEDRITNNIANGKASYFGARHAGVIASTTSTADGIKVTFKKEPYTYRETECIEDRSHIRGFDSDGKIQWGWVCNQSGKQHTVMRGEDAVVIPKDNAALVATGRAMTFAVDDKATGTATAFPLEVFSDKGKTQLIGAFDFGSGGGTVAAAPAASTPVATTAKPKAKNGKKKKKLVASR